jgi:tRNA G18 (ribose-2'-O)-methylase SpoU
MEPIVVDDPSDPRLADYVDLTDPELRVRVEADRGFFVAESPHVIRTVVGAGATVRSLLLTPAQLDGLGDVVAAATAPVYVAPPSVLRRVVGFDLHRGAVASVERPPLADPDRIARDARLVAVLERVNDHENLGGIFRNAAALAVDAVVLDPQCADPWYRRCVRVSIGHVCTVPWARAAAWPAALDHLRGLGFTVVALTPGGDVDIDDVPARAGGRVAVVAGAEGPGLSEAALARADLRARIPMAAGVDSLNVATALAIAFHGLRARS